MAAAARDLRDSGAISMGRVAAAAEVSRSTLYRHFPTRDSLVDALRAEGLAAARRAVEEALAEDRPPLAVLRRLVEGLVEVAAERRLEALPAEPVADAALPAVRRLLGAVEMTPELPAAWLRKATSHFVEACFRTGVDSAADPASGAAELFRSLTDPLDQGLVVLDRAGRFLSANPRGERMLAITDRLEVGKTLPAMAAELLYEDGSPAPADAHPLLATIRTGEPQRGVRGQRDRAGEIAWTLADARPLHRRRDDGPYGFLGILSDVSAEQEWKLKGLRPPGELEPVSPVPLDLARTLDEIPPHLFPEQFVAEARRVSGHPVALYVVDIDGTHLLRLAGPEEYPERLAAPLALGPELAEDGIPALTASLESELPGVTVAPMWLRGRAIGLLLALRAPLEPLVELGRLAAAAMELAGGYTDVVDAARRRKETTPAAELQQSLLPPRIARIGGGELAGSVLPSYEVGGDWFDYVENRDGAWLAIADAAGKGATAGALGGIALAALRAERRSGGTLESAAQKMHQVVRDVSRPEFFVTAIVARWQAVYSVFSWVNCGHPPPLVVRPDGSLDQLEREPALPLGLFDDEERRFSRHRHRLEEGERLILHSDGITARRTESGLFGLDGIERAVRGASGTSASAIARAIQEAVMSASVDPLQDDAVAIVLAPTPR